MPAVTGVQLSLWRALTLLRGLTLLACLYLIVRWRGIYAHPGVAFAVGAAMIVVTLAAGTLALRGRAHRPLVVWLDLAVTVGLTLASIAAQTDAQRFAQGMPTLTTIWAIGPVIGIAYVHGWLGGVVAALAQFGAALIVRDGHDGRTVTSGFLLIVVGAVTGYVATLAVRAERELAAAVEARTALAERERLARSVHDGVLQTLALLHRRGLEAGGSWAELGATAARQESALRRLMAAGPDVPSGARDLVTALRTLGGERVSIAVPAEPVLLPAAVADELAAAVEAALDNVRRHAGPDARAWVLLDELDDELEVVVRDDGAGVAEGRLAEAAAAGRLGVRQSIRGRLATLGGTAEVTSAPGAGTTVSLRLPIDRGRP